MLLKNERINAGPIGFALTMIMQWQVLMIMMSVVEGVSCNTAKCNFMWPGMIGFPKKIRWTDRQTDR